MSIELNPRQQLTYTLLTCTNFSGFGGDATRKPDRVKISFVHPEALDGFGTILKDLDIEYTLHPQDQSSYIISKGNWDRKIAEPSEGVLLPLKSLWKANSFNKAKKFGQLCELLNQAQDAIELEEAPRHKKIILYFCSAKAKDFFEENGFALYPSQRPKKGYHVFLPRGLRVLLNHHFGKELGRPGCLDIYDVHYQSTASSVASSSGQPRKERDDLVIGKPRDCEKQQSPLLEDESEATPRKRGVFSGSAAAVDVPDADQEKPCCSCILL